MAQINSPWDLLLLMASSNVAPFWTFTGRPSTHRLTRAVAAATGACFAISLLTLIAVFFITVDNWLLSIVIGLCEMMEYPHYQVYHQKKVSVMLRIADAWHLLLDDR